MISTPQSRIDLIKELIRIPSVTGSPEEASAADFIMERLSRLEYFRRNRSHLCAVPTPLEGDDRPLFSVAARIMAHTPTPKTVVFISHYDVVDASAYGDMRALAFDPDGLAPALGAEPGWLYGRGSMDMKCGIALEMELLRDYDADPGMFDVNIIALFVPDEENSACGMRGASRWLASLKRGEGLEYIACIDTEPSEPGMPDASGEVVFLGSLGKLMPAFYCRGVEAHVGNYYKGLSASLLSSHVVCLAEAEPSLADPHRGACYPSWICLRQATLGEVYSVTVPNRAIAYFNCLTTGKAPSAVVSEMKDIARRAALSASERVSDSHDALSALGYRPGRSGFDVRVIEFADVCDAASKRHKGGAEGLRAEIDAFILRGTRGDMRERGVAALERAIDIAGIEPPFIAVGFLPPYNPQITSASVPHAVRAAQRVVREARGKHGVAMETADFFAGISDMSFAGFSGSDADIEAYSRNCPCWGSLFEVPFNAMREICMPVMNIGPRGRDAHKRAERLDTRYSLDVLPELLVCAVRALSEEWDHEKAGEK